MRMNESHIRMNESRLDTMRRARARLLNENNTDMKHSREKMKTARTGRTKNRAIDKSVLKGLMRNVEEIFVDMTEAGFLESDPEMATVQKLWEDLNKLF